MLQFTIDQHGLENLRPLRMHERFGWVARRYMRQLSFYYQSVWHIGYSPQWGSMKLPLHRDMVPAYRCRLSSWCTVQTNQHKLYCEYSFKVAISECEKGERWQHADSLLNDFKCTTYVTIVFSGNAYISESERVRSGSMQFHCAVILKWHASHHM